MIRKSPEIEAIIRRFTSAIRTHNVQDLPHYLSQDDSLTYIGTAEDETWHGQVVRDGISAHLGEVPDFSEDDISITAYENGDTGWGHYQSRFTFHATGATGMHRATYLFVMEHGGWKLVHHHLSEAASNMEKLGIEHTAFRDLLDAAQAEDHDFGTEGLASIMFTDIADSTQLAALVGDRVWIGVLDRHMQIVTSCIHAHGGELVKSLGDGTMSAFPSARNALLAALDLQSRIQTTPEQPTIAVRIGIHTGEVIRSHDDFFGTVVNKAARVAAATTPGEIRVSDATRLIAGDGPGHAFSTPLSTPLKGLDGDHLTYQLIAT
ncbi:nuclear transport factor 2 family protein [Shimia sp.]|uniref:nuclear transport factor 2 family protein n=1 Tax=Shimia sp. TaxID=1954381 RepID=UPI0032972361